MPGIRTLIAAIVFCAACSVVVADWSVSNRGTWPDSWPKELEPLRQQSGSIQRLAADAAGREALRIVAERIDLLDE